ncbi:hypothetical protein [Novipirellula caenicola]|uniref:HEAT repeat protein n=1 Tax=Novipirellula caenicola TaxID=1536901 RepID=A0ABP9VZ50_9BACT
MPPKLTTWIVMWGLISASVVAATAADHHRSGRSGDQLVESLIQQLDSAKFSHRQRAMRQLHSLGKQAIEKLATATHSESREVADRAFDILQQHLIGNDTHLELAARETLQSLSQSESAKVAQRAKRLLEPDSNDWDELNPFVPGGAVVRRQALLRNPLQAGIRIQVGGLNQQPRARRTIRIQFNNGIKSVEVTENNKTIKVAGKADGSIEVTETNAGKPSPTKTYKNEDTLKKENPSAYQIFQQGGIPNPQFVPPIPINPPFPPR